MVFDLALVLLITASAGWVYWDATTNKIGKIPNQKGFFNLSAGVWGIVTFGLWIIGFPAYLVKRKGLIEKAKTAPIEVKQRDLKLALLLIVGPILMWTVQTYSAVKKIPSCDDQRVIQYVGRTVNDMPRIKNAGVQVVSLSNVRPKSYNHETMLRVCVATLVTSKPGLLTNVEYRLRPDSKGGRKIHIEARLKDN